MKRPVLIGIVVVIVIGLAIFGITKGVGSLFGALGASETSAKSVGDAAMAAITKTWDPNALNGLAAPEYQESLKSSAVWDTYKGLGSASSLDPCAVQGLNINNGNGTAQLSCAAQFAKGPATFEVTLTSSDWGSSWKVSALALAS